MLLIFLALYGATRKLTSVFGSAIGCGSLSSVLHPSRAPSRAPTWRASTACTLQRPALCMLSSPGARGVVYPRRPRCGRALYGASGTYSRPTAPAAAATTPVSQRAATGGGRAAFRGPVAQPFHPTPPPLPLPSFAHFPSPACQYVVYAAAPALWLRCGPGHPRGSPTNSFNFY